MSQEMKESSRYVREKSPDLWPIFRALAATKGVTVQEALAEAVQEWVINRKDEVAQAISRAGKAG